MNFGMESFLSTLVPSERFCCVAATDGLVAPDRLAVIDKSEEREVPGEAEEVVRVGVDGDILCSVVVIC